MNVLELPIRLKGAWDHALIMTYGLDISFFERTLLPQFATCCRNKIILADGQHYLDACTQYAQKEAQIYHFNQSYIAAGIFGPRDAHAKVLLLLNKEQGLLCIGSGNLSWQGYASGGELFSYYEYSANSSETLSAFLAIRELTDGLIQRRYIQGVAKRYIGYIWDETPWLLRTPIENSRPVRHNLTQSFLTQIEQVVDGETVEELSIFAPFFDKEAIALSRLIDTVHPRHTKLLLQPGRTSADPKTLQRVLDQLSGSYEVRPFQMKGESTYIHAKCYVLKLEKRAICLQGSPNLSQVAMLLNDPYSNIEVANLLTGERNAFDYLFEGLEIGAPVIELTSLQLVYQTIEKPEESPENACQLTGGEWDGHRLALNFRGTLRDLQGAELTIGNKRFPLQVYKMEDQRLELLLGPIAAELIAHPVPVALCWHESANEYVSNQIFVCNCVALDAILRRSLESETLKHTADLDLNDKDFEELLNELQQTLIVDERSIWTIAGHTTPISQTDDDKALQLSYEDINYETLRQHPKIRQYLESTISYDAYTRSRLQIILNSVLLHLAALLQEDHSLSTYHMNSLSPTIEESEDEAIAEISQTSEDAQKRLWTTQRRISRTLKNFIRRYLLGCRNPNFQRIVGFEVVTKNYIIFSQMLWQLFTKDWVEPSFIIDALLQSWNTFWENWKPEGHFYYLDVNQQLQIWQLIRDYCNDALTLAGFFYGTHLADVERWQGQKFALRDSWRQFLCLSPFPLVHEVLSDAQKLLALLFPYDPPTSTVIVDRLAQLARFETRASFQRQLEAPGRAPIGSCSFKKETVERETLGRRTTVDCLVIQSPTALAGKETAVALLQEWMLAETLDYYRIAVAKRDDPTAVTHIIYYDVVTQRGKYWDKEQGIKGQKTLEAVPLPAREWDTTLAQLRTMTT